MAKLTQDLAPERWQLAAGDAASATLVIPPDAKRERRFEIACAVTVGVPADASAPWHQMLVLANGAQQWMRRVPSSNAGSYDGLDYRFARSVPVGQALRVTVSVTGQGVARRSLVIEADEL
jgi:MaoC like domain